MLETLKVILTILLVFSVLTQVRRPSGLIGRAVAWGMNHSHSALTDWALGLVPLRRNDTILDIGCGGGRTVQKLAALAPEGTVTGIDYSAASVATARRTSAQEIDAGRVKIEFGSVAALPFPDRTFDVVTAVETHYYWPDLPASLREVLRVLKPGGTFAIIAEAYRGERLNPVYAVVMRLIRARYLSTSEHRDLLTQAGFTEVATAHAPNGSWMCATGRGSQ